MRIDESVTARLAELIEQSRSVASMNEHGQTVDLHERSKCAAWIVAAQNVSHLVLPNASSPYRIAIDKLANANHGFVIGEAVSELASILRSLSHDAEKGLLASVANQARAEVFDDFLDHADFYLNDNRKEPAGTIAGVVFEDAVRRLCKKHSIDDTGKTLDPLISALASKAVISGIRAKRLRAAAALRTSASHALWDEFELADVRVTIDLTRELITSDLDG